MQHELDLLEMVEKYGTANLVFVFRGKHGDSPIVKPFKITEECYKLSEKYKVQLKSLEELSKPKTITPGSFLDGAFCETFYISDFRHLVEDGIVNVYVQTEDGFHLVKGTLTDLLSPEDTKAIEYVTSNFNLMANFI